MTTDSVPNHSTALNLLRILDELVTYREDLRMDRRRSNEDRTHLSRDLREKRTVEAMIRIHCRAHHGDRDELCRECEMLLMYCQSRLDRCPFGGDKPVCAKCRIHCYKPEMRERIREVMRFAGPRMLLHHPVLAIRHLIDSYFSGR